MVARRRWARAQWPPADSGLADERRQRVTQDAAHRGECRPIVANVGNSAPAAASSTASTSGAANGCCPAIASYITSASPHRSKEGCGVTPASASGARYRGVPTSRSDTVTVDSGSAVRTTSRRARAANGIPVGARSEAPLSNAKPKSSNFGRPSTVKPMLLGFTSRCSTPASCTRSRTSARTIPSSIAFTNETGPRRSQSRSVPPRRYSTINIGVPRHCSVP